MIGNITTGKSFFHCISYCLEDKQELSEEQKRNLSRNDHLHHKDRAEVLYYNKCDGDKYDLSRQFNEVRKLSRRVEKPVLHISLRLAPGESLTNDQLTKIGQEAAKEFGVADHQYLCVLHKDTREQHIHIVANRVGFDGKAASDSNNYRKMAALCRRLEKEYNLQEVLSPRKFLPAKERLLPRQDIRKERLKTDIATTLKAVRNFHEFEQAMEAKGYRIIKGRGITFIDDKKVKVKGSEVGFSLATIGKVLNLREQVVIAEKEEARQQKPFQAQTRHYTPGQRLLYETMEGARNGLSVAYKLNKQIDALLYHAFKLEQVNDYISPELLREAKKKKKHQLSR